MVLNATIASTSDSQNIAFIFLDSSIGTIAVEAPRQGASAAIEGRPVPPQNTGRPPMNDFGLLLLTSLDNKPELGGLCASANAFGIGDCRSSSA